ncbi:hypothetical protein N9D95_03115, partial [Flavobacteriales bacterium]|nr:hypothetical protein [Flavobacteriales bacterium]
CDGNVIDECGVCGGDGIAEGACDCDGNVLDECGVCNGDGIAEGDCDCDGSQLDAIGACGGSCQEDVNDNGVCDDEEPTGCTVAVACNYDPAAVFDDDSCDFTSCFVFGCNDANACNFDPDADFNDGSCTYASFPYDCNDECVNDDDGDGICNEFEVAGCTDATACNWRSWATPKSMTSPSQRQALCPMPFVKAQWRTAINWMPTLSVGQATGA